MTKFADSHHSSVTAAARTFAECALPDVSVLGADEPSDIVASELEAHCWKQEKDVPEDVGEDHWRAECRAALRARIDAYRVTLTLAETDDIERRALAAAMREP
jgi:hypothetical protein